MAPKKGFSTGGTMTQIMPLSWAVATMACDPIAAAMAATMSSPRMPLCSIHSILLVCVDPFVALAGLRRDRAGGGPS